MQTWNFQGLDNPFPGFRGNAQYKMTPYVSEGFLKKLLTVAIRLRMGGKLIGVKSNTASCSSPTERPER